LHRGSGTGTCVLKAQKAAALRDVDVADEIRNEVEKSGSRLHKPTGDD
jgi:hypothetical protein